VWNSSERAPQLTQLALDHAAGQRDGPQRRDGIAPDASANVNDEIGPST
jgi:hypothetical protein